ncbi:MAG TPA: hypothetical protein VN380_13445 [Thermoanaerobaculia bacterium]|nr:hypothetical protein [Thermoanaerobaculia bacterium]
MTRNRKADLQRKLTMAPVATPPAGLAGRIKSEIPSNMGFESERTQSRKSAMFNLRIAASIILLVSSLYLVLHLLSRTDANMRSMPVADDKTAATAPRMAVALPNTPPQPGTSREQPRTDLPVMPSTPPTTSVTTIPNTRIAEAKREEADGMSTGRPSYSSSVENEGPAVKPQPIVAEAAPAPAAAAPPPPPSLALARDRAATAGAVAEGRVFAPEPSAAKTAVPQERIAARDDAPVRNFVAIQEAISHGATLGHLDTSAIVQHFAAPERRPADLRVELEASAAPLNASKWLLRVSVDGPVTNATSIDLEFGDAVAAHHALTGSPAPNETALYEIEFKPNATPDQTIATVRAGKAEGVVRVTDLRRWNAASTRMKRASLAATWARTPQSHTQSEAIVAKAREAHIDDLADIVERVERNQ